MHWLESETQKFGLINSIDTIRHIGPSNWTFAKTSGTVTRDRELANREPKQQRRRRIRKRHLKSEIVLPQTLSRLFHLV